MIRDDRRIPSQEHNVLRCLEQSREMALLTEEHHVERLKGLVEKGDGTKNTVDKLDQNWAPYETQNSLRTTLAVVTLRRKELHLKNQNTVANLMRDRRVGSSGTWRTTKYVVR